MQTLWEITCVSCCAPGMQGLRGSEMTLENEASFCSQPDLNLYIYLVYTFLFLVSSLAAETFTTVVQLPQRPLRSLCFTFPMFETTDGRSVESGCNDVRSAGRRQDVLTLQNAAAAGERWR